MIEDNDTIVVKKNNGIEYIQFKKLLELGIKHAYTLKGEGLNFRSSSENEKESYKKICDAIGVDVLTKTKPLQTHTSNVRCIDKPMKLEELPLTDGLITDKENIVLASTNADCILFFIYDPVKKVIANVHSGWKGTFQKILEKAINKMIINYKSNPKDIIVAINPCIRQDHFEVDEDVMQLCVEIFRFLGDTEKFIKKGQIKNNKQKYYIDTVYINKKMLVNLGIKEENILDSEICSVCESEKVHSYRVEGKEFKLATAIISL